MTSYITSLNQDDYVITVNQFLSAVKNGTFTDYDGFGHPVKDQRHAQLIIKPSKIKEIPNDTTHIVWYGR